MTTILTLTFLACWSPSGWPAITECVAETFAVESSEQCQRLADHRVDVLTRDGATIFVMQCDNPVIGIGT